MESKIINYETLITILKICFFHTISLFSANRIHLMFKYEKMLFSRNFIFFYRIINFTTEINILLFIVIFNILTLILNIELKIQILNKISTRLS